jgi:hypothetical protein
MNVLNHVFSTQNIGFQQARKTFHIEKTVTESRVEAPAIEVPPGRSRFDKERLEFIACDPILYRMGDEFQAVVRADEFRSTVLFNNFFQGGHDIVAR